MTNTNHLELYEYYDRDEIDWGSYYFEFGYSHNN